MKAVTIAGVRYTPQWAWSPEYRRDFAARMRAQSRYDQPGIAGPRTMDEANYRSPSERYRRWLAAERGSNHVDAIIAEQHRRMVIPVQEFTEPE